MTEMNPSDCFAIVIPYFEYKLMKWVLVGNLIVCAIMIIDRMVWRWQQVRHGVDRRSMPH